ncbi:MAG TPA: J domain-containing protein, partial [Rhodopila sp.]|uniref:J domain-containing protein n=1 Tax=Rhodopila sp. TaxID=2480087 RepID=UPI002B76D722
MPPPRSNLDPEGHYARLALEPGAAHDAVVAAYRAKARVLHPDVPVTGDAAAFLAVKQSYDVLSDRERRAAYDREARDAAMAAVEPAMFPARPVRHVMSASMAMPSPRLLPRLSDLPLMVWIGVGMLLTVGVVQVVLHLRDQPVRPVADIPATAQAVAPLTGAAHREVLYGPAPEHLPGTANFYVTPGSGEVTLYRRLPDQKLQPVRRLPPFSSVQVVRLLRQEGLFEVVTGERSTGFIAMSRLTSGNVAAAHEAFCGYNAGTLPQDGEVLDREGTGHGTLAVDNRSVEPAVLRLRSAAGTPVVSVFLAPGGHAELTALPDGNYRPEYAIGELWSRACNSFAAGMRA